MIWESYVWKDDLLKRGRKLEKRRTQARWSDHSLALAEQEIMIGYFSIRKLIESDKVSDVIAQQDLPVEIVPATGKKKTTKLNHRQIDRLFDFERSRKGNRKLKFVCDQVIHSLVFMLLMEEESNGLVSFMVASDWKKNDQAIIVPIDTTVTVFRQIGENYPNNITMTRNSKGDYDVTLGL